ncbi:MAG TPA: hypothetical protein VKV79_03895, partial [Terriglobia bacterium]|nr:hypothetical protein [Terriglobia bacterium]
MPQAIQVETQPKQQGSALLHGQQAAGRTSRELLLHRGENAFDQSTAVRANAKSPTSAIALAAS